MAFAKIVSDDAIITNLKNAVQIRSQWRETRKPQHKPANQQNRRIAFCMEAFQNSIPSELSDLFLDGTFPDVRQRAQPQFHQTGEPLRPPRFPTLVAKHLRHWFCVIAPMRLRIQAQQFPVNSFGNGNRFWKLFHDKLYVVVTPTARAVSTILE